MEFLDKKISITKKTTKIQADNNSSIEDEIKDSFTKPLQQNILPNMKSSITKHIDNISTKTNNNNNSKKNPIFLTQTKQKSLYSNKNKNNIIKNLTLTRENLLKLQRSFQLNKNGNIDIDDQDDDGGDCLRDMTLESDLKYTHSYDFYLR